MANRVEQYLALAAEYDQTMDSAVWAKMASLLEAMKGRELTMVARARKAAQAVNPNPTEGVAMTTEAKAEIVEQVQEEVNKPKVFGKASKAKQFKKDVEAKAKAKKEAQKAKFAALKEKAKAKKKEPKPEKDYGWTKHPDAGSVCYVPSGKAVLVSISKDKEFVQVRSENDEKMHIHKSSVVRWKAFNEDLRDRYTKDPAGTRTISGTVSVSIGDDVAKALNGLTIEQLAEVAETANADERFKGWASLNPGMQRMNLGNVLRGMLRSEVPESVKDAKAATAKASKMPRLYEPKAKPAKVAKAAPKKATGAKTKGKTKAA